MDIIATYPRVIYHVFMKDGSEIDVDNPIHLPDPSTIDHIEEPVIDCRVMIPSTYIGDVMNLVMSKRGVCTATDSVDARHVIITARYADARNSDRFSRQIKSLRAGTQMDYDRPGIRPAVGQNGYSGERRTGRCVGRSFMWTWRMTASSFCRAASRRDSAQMFTIAIQAAIGGK